MGFPAGHSFQALNKQRLECGVEPPFLRQLSPDVPARKAALAGINEGALIPSTLRPWMLRGSSAACGTPSKAPVWSRRGLKASGTARMTSVAPLLSLTERSQH